MTARHPHHARTLVYKMINEISKAYPLVQSRVLSDNAGTAPLLVLSNIAEVLYIDR